MGKKKLKQELLMELVVAHYSVTLDDIRSKSRLRPIPEARQVCSLVLKMNTKLSLFSIADLIGYKTHASPIRDIRIINNYLDVYPTYRDKIIPLINAARHLAKSYDSKTLIVETRTGDICWFWNDGMKFPVIGTLMHSYYNEDKKARFITSEDPTSNYCHCEYAGVDVIPDCFFKLPKREEYAAAVMLP